MMSFLLALLAVLQPLAWSAVEAIGHSPAQCPATHTLYLPTPA